MTKRTVEQLEADAKRAEQRAKELRAKAKKLTQAEEAKKNAELLKAVHAWGETYQNGRYKDNLVELFQSWTKRNNSNTG